MNTARWLALLLLVAPAVADQEMADGAVKKIKEAVRAKDADACKAAFKEAELFKPDAAQAKRVSDELAKAVKALEKKHPDLAVAALKTIGHLQSPGATKRFKSLLRAPRRRCRTSASAST